MTHVCGTLINDANRVTRLIFIYAFPGFIFNSQPKPDRSETRCIRVPHCKGVPQLYIILQTRPTNSIHYYPTPDTTILYDLHLNTSVELYISGHALHFAYVLRCITCPNSLYSTHRNPKNGYDYSSRYFISKYFYTSNLNRFISL